MKRICIFLLFVFIILSITQSYIFADDFHENIIEESAVNWKSNYISKLECNEQVQTIIDILLLSYLIAKESCSMVVAKLTIQEELISLYTPSIAYSLQANQQIKNNDLTIIKKNVQLFEESQEQLQSLFKIIKSVGKKLLHINPKPTQILITNLKNALIAWGKEQSDITEQLIMIQDDFQGAVEQISDIKIIFDTMLQSIEPDHSHLKKAATSLSNTYKDIEHVMVGLSNVRKESILKIQSFFDVFFHTYYEHVYQALSSDQKESLFIQSTFNQKLPCPDAFFI